MKIFITLASFVAVSLAVQLTEDDELNSDSIFLRSHKNGKLDVTQRWMVPGDVNKTGEERLGGASVVHTSIKPLAANWFTAYQFCRLHDMQLATISSEQENDELFTYISDLGLIDEWFWTSGTDKNNEGVFVWMANGRPFTFTNWELGAPDNYISWSGETDDCMAVKLKDDELIWGDGLCSASKHYFICEIATVEQS